jgi:hypothetical protein
LRSCGTAGKPGGNREDKHQPVPRGEPGLLTKGTCQEKKNNPSARNSVFFLGTRRLREWAAKWLVGAAAHLIDSFAPEPIPPNALRKSPFLFLTQDDPYGFINFFPFAVVSLGLSMSVS